MPYSFRARYCSAADESVFDRWIYIIQSDARLRLARIERAHRPPVRIRCGLESFVCVAPAARAETVNGWPLERP